MNQAPSMLKPALISGAAFGVAGAIPVINWLNCACCALIIGSGLLGAFLNSRDCRNAGAFKRFVETIKLLATAPGEAFEQMPTVGDIGRPLLFAIVVGWIGIGAYAVWWLIFGGMSLPFLDSPELGEAGLLFGFPTGFTLVFALVAVILLAVLCCGFLAALTFMGVPAGIASSQ